MLERALLLCLALALQSEAPAAAQAANERDVVRYEMRAGDNLYELARDHFRRVADYVRVQRLNGIEDPYRIAVGRVVRIPRELLRYEPLSAHVISYRGTVRIRRGGRALPVSVNMAVREGDEIATAANSFVSIGLSDKSVVALPSQSEVTVVRLRRVSLTGGVERLFAVENGRARAVVSPLETDDDFRFSTPIAVSAVRGTEFRVSYSKADHRATTGTLSGEVAVSAPSAAAPDEASRTIAAGFGTVASRAGLTDAVPLLPAPRLADPGKVQDEAGLAFEVETLAGAAAYHVQVAHDAGFLDVVAETHSRDPLVSMPAVDDGTWFVRVSGIGAMGLEGRYATYGFQRRLNRIEAGVDVARAGRFRQYLFRWEVEGEGERQYRFQLSRNEDLSEPIVDEPGLSAQRFIVTDLPAGTYHWRVMTLQFVDGEVHAKWSPAERLTIAAEE